MRKIVQQMLKGEPVVFDDEILEESEQQRQECERLLQHFHKILSKQDFDNLLHYLDAEKIFYPAVCEDMYAEGLKTGILLGLDTLGAFDVKRSVLHKIFMRNRMRYEKISVSDELEKEKSEYYRKANEDIDQDLFQFTEFTDLESSNLDMYIEKEDAHFVAGIRKGIILGIEAGKLLARTTEK